MFSGKLTNIFYTCQIFCLLAKVQAVFDWIGRSFATFIQWPKLGKTGKVFLCSCVLLRTGFLPLVMKCNVLPGCSLRFSFDNKYFLKSSKKDPSVVSRRLELHFDIFDIQSIGRLP